jgi:hypothetical protein
MLSHRGRGPDGVEIVLMHMHPHKAGDEIQARWRILFGLLEDDPVGSESFYNLRVGIGKGVLRIRSEQQDKRRLRLWDGGHNVNETDLQTLGSITKTQTNLPNSARAMCYKTVLAIQTPESQAQIRPELNARM